MTACAGCGEMLFVLPLSRLPAFQSDARQTPRRGWLADQWQRVAHVSPWAPPLAAGAITLLIAVVSFALILYGHLPSRRGVIDAGPEAIASNVQAGERALSQGKFRLAAQVLSAAENLRVRYPDTLSLADRRQLTQLYRQAALLADLLSESLNEVLQHAADLTELDEREWQATFRARFEGRSVVFEDDVRRDSAGTCRLLGYPLFVRGQRARLALGDLDLLRLLPLDTSQRLLFGARLARIRRDYDGTWVVHLQPDSGVLLTDFGAATACTPLAPAELRAILARQAAWVAELR
jgi:hypothetical protein